MIIGNRKVKHLDLPDEIKQEDCLFRPFRNLLVIKTTDYNVNILKLEGHDLVFRETLEEVVEYIYTNYLEIKYNGGIGNHSSINIEHNRGLIDLLSQSPYYSCKFLKRFGVRTRTHKLEKAVLSCPKTTLLYALTVNVNLPKFAYVLKDHPHLLKEYNDHFYGNKKAP